MRFAVVCGVCILYYVKELVAMKDDLVLPDAKLNNSADLFEKDFNAKGLDYVLDSDGRSEDDLIADGYIKDAESGVYKKKTQRKNSAGQLVHYESAVEVTPGQHLDSFDEDAPLSGLDDKRTTETRTYRSKHSGGGGGGRIIKTQTWTTKPVVTSSSRHYHKHTESHESKSSDGVHSSGSSSTMRTKISNNNGGDGRTIRSVTKERYGDARGDSGGSGSDTESNATHRTRRTQRNTNAYDRTKKTTDQWSLGGTDKLETDQLEKTRRRLSSARRHEEEQELAKKLEERLKEEERLEAQRLEAQRVLAEKRKLEKTRRRLSSARRQEEELAKKFEEERLEVKRLEEERLEVKRLEEEQLEVKRLEEERLEAQRVLAEKRKLEEARRPEEEQELAKKLEERLKEEERLEAQKLEAQRLEEERVLGEKRIFAAERKFREKKRQIIIDQDRGLEKLMREQETNELEEAKKQRFEEVKHEAGKRVVSSSTSSSGLSKHNYTPQLKSRVKEQPQHTYYRTVGEIKSGIRKGDTSKGRSTFAHDPHRFIRGNGNSDSDSGDSNASSGTRRHTSRRTNKMTEDASSSGARGQPRTSEVNGTLGVEDFNVSQNSEDLTKKDFSSSNSHSKHKSTNHQSHRTHQSRRAHQSHHSSHSSHSSHSTKGFDSGWKEVSSGPVRHITEPEVTHKRTVTTTTRRTHGMTAGSVLTPAS